MNAAPTTVSLHLLQLTNFVVNGAQKPVRRRRRQTNLKDSENVTVVGALCAAWWYIGKFSTWVVSHAMAEWCLLTWCLYVQVIHLNGTVQSSTFTQNHPLSFGLEVNSLCLVIKQYFCFYGATPPAPAITWSRYVRVPALSSLAILIGWFDSIPALHSSFTLD